MKKVTVVFPMAGEGQRFGNKFKPFLKIFDKTFIELAIEPFLKHKEQIEKFIFIVQEKHEKEFRVGHELTKIMPVDIAWIIEEIKPTKNVIETINCLFYICEAARISRLFDYNESLKDVIFCDCDHRLNVDGIFKAIEEDKYECIVPGWKISKEEESKWSIACVDDDNMVCYIEEKHFPLVPEGDFNVYGVIGCYYFKEYQKDVDLPRSYLSEIVETKETKLIPITEAEFFGDPERLHNLYVEKNASTIFCDLDGTVIKHENIPNYTKGIELLEGAKEKIEEWRKNNSFIVLTTSRDEQFRTEMELMLRNAGIKYEYLVMGLPPGARYLINDKKPYSEKTMASSIEVKRDEGIKNVAIGHSVAKFDVRNGVAYKTISLASDAYETAKFQNQIKSMLKLGDCAPKILSYGMEFLDYKGFDKLTPNERVDALNILFGKLETLYCNKGFAPQDWLNNFMRLKINSKASKLNDLGVSNTILEFTNDVFYSSLNLDPRHLVDFYHGDLTYENILYKNGDIKLIDTDNDDSCGAIELDLGKLMQSVLTGYERWPEETEINKAEFYLIINFYQKILGETIAQVKEKAYFYCVLHLIRMMPYQARIDASRVKIAEKHCIKLLNDLKNGTY